MTIENCDGMQHDHINFRDVALDILSNVNYESTDDNISDVQGKCGITCGVCGGAKEADHTYVNDVMKDGDTNFDPGSMAGVNGGTVVEGINNNTDDVNTNHSDSDVTNNIDAETLLKTHVQNLMDTSTNKFV